MKKLFLFLTLMIAGTGMAQADSEIISGEPVVIDSTHMLVDGIKITLADIISVSGKTACTWKNRALDCSVLATAGLQDLVVASKVKCTRLDGGKYRCSAGGYDLAYGLVHSGWAVPDKSAPARYFNKSKQSRQHKRGFWAARTASGTLVAESLN